jgi:urease accessory protein
VRASARIVARSQPDGTTRLTTLAGEAPLLLRRTGPRGAHVEAPAPQSRPHGPPPRPEPALVHLVGGAAGPLGGDELRCLVDLGPGACLEVRSVAASVALPGPRGRESSLDIQARVGEGGALLWSPQPLIAARGARHRTVARVELAADCRLVWRDALILGREGEEPGSASSRLRVVRAGRILLDHEVAAGPRHPGSLGPAGSGGHRALGMVLIVDPAWEAASDGIAQVVPKDEPAVAIAAMRLSGPAVLVAAVAADGPALARALDRALPHA